MNVLLEYLPPEGLEPGLHAQRQTVAGGANRGESLGGLARSIAHHVQHGAEFFARQLARMAQLDQMGCDEAAMSVRLAEAAGLDDARLPAHALDVAVESLLRGPGDDGPHVGLKIGRIADHELLHGACDHLDHGVRDLLLQEQEPQRRAPLTRAHEGGSHHIVRHLLRQRGRIDQHRVQSAGLGDQRDDGAVAGGKHALNGERRGRRPRHDDSRRARGE